MLFYACLDLGVTAGKVQLPEGVSGIPSGPGLSSPDVSSSQGLGGAEETSSAQPTTGTSASDGPGIIHGT